jgi:diazepam-binding inhibitor (GABA receptor modulating acyl-CoA-binding protein)
MPTVQEQFETAAQEVQGLSRRPGDDVLLQLYALYKQGTTGDAKGARPGGFDFVGRAKFDAWSKLKGMSQDTAMKAYIALVEKLKAS